MEAEIKIKSSNELHSFPIHFFTVSTKEKIKVFDGMMRIYQILNGQKVHVANVEIKKVKLASLEAYKIYSLEVLPQFQHRKDEIIKRVGTRIVENINKFLIERSQLLKKRGDGQVYGILVDGTDERNNPDEAIGFYKKHNWRPFFEDADNVLYFFPEELNAKNKETFMRIPD